MGNLGFSFLPKNIKTCWLTNTRIQLQTRRRFAQCAWSCGSKQPEYECVSQRNTIERYYHVKRNVIGHYLPHACALASRCEAADAKQPIQAWPQCCAWTNTTLHFSQSHLRQSPHLSCMTWDCGGKPGHLQDTHRQKTHIQDTHLQKTHWQKTHMQDTHVIYI